MIRTLSRTGISAALLAGVAIAGCDKQAQKPTAGTAATPAASAPAAVGTPATSSTAVATVSPPTSSPAVSTPPAPTAPSTSSVTASTTSASAGAVDTSYQPYKPVSGVAGSIKSVGSDTMNNLMNLWLEDFKKHYPSVQAEVEGKGSGSAPPALIAGTAAFGPMSRPMKDSEIAEFEKAKGHKPTALPTAIDVLAIYVHKDNPLASLTLQQADAVFSKTRKGGFAKDVTTWGDLGLTGEWATQPIRLYGRNSASGTYGFFKEHVLLNGDFKDSVKEQPGSSAVVQSVATDKWGIGYSGIGYKTADVRAVPLAANSGEPAVEATAENGISGDYALTRALLVYVDYKPGTALDPLRREFIRYIFSRDGQQDVMKDGYIPATPLMAQEALKSIGIAEGK